MKQSGTDCSKLKLWNENAIKNKGYVNIFRPKRANYRNSLQAKKITLGAKIGPAGLHLDHTALA